MDSFEHLIESRRRWIREVLQPWCSRAARRDLRRAELEWPDIAGRADPQTTLWLWAWGRFPDLVSEGVSGIDETWRVRVALTNGRSCTGYPDSRQSEQGQLVLVGDSPPVGETLGPFSIDEIVEVVRVAD